MPLHRRPREAEASRVARQLDEGFTPPQPRRSVGMPAYTPVTVDAAIANIQHGGDPDADAAVDEHRAPRVYLHDILQGLQPPPRDPAADGGAPSHPHQVGPGLGASASALLLSGDVLGPQPSVTSVQTTQSAAPALQQVQLPRKANKGGSVKDDVFFLRTLLRVAGRPTEEELRRAPSVPEKYDMCVDPRRGT